MQRRVPDTSRYMEREIVVDTSDPPDKICLMANHFSHLDLQSRLDPLVYSLPLVRTPC